MPKSIVFVLVFLCSSVLLYSQDEARLNDLAGQATPDEPLAQNIEADDESPVRYRKVMVIPYEPKLYMSDIDKDVALKTGLSSHEIKARFRAGLANNVFVASDRHYGVVSMLSDDPEVWKDLAYIYKSIGYKYTVIAQPEDATKETATEKIISKFRKKPDKEQPGARIEKGQVVSTANNYERYMSTRIINPAMLQYLSAKYETGLYIFINQLDIMKAADTDYRDLAAEDYKRQIKVHYTIMDSRGNEIYGGAARYYFSSRINDLNKIITGMFPDVAGIIASHLPAGNSPPAIKAKGKTEEKKAKKQEEELMKQY